MAKGYEAPRRPNRRGIAMLTLGADEAKLVAQRTRKRTLANSMAGRPACL